MAGRIGLETGNPSVNLAAGETNVISITVTNGGAVVDAFDLTVRNLDPSWYELTPSRLSLFPKAQGVATLILHPPAAARALAGEYNFELVATSRDANSEFASLPMRIMLAASGEVSVEIEPKRIVGRKGTYRVTLNNASNTERTLVLRPTDEGELLAFTFGPAQFWSLSDAERTQTSLQAQGMAPPVASEYVSQGQSVGESVTPTNPVYEWVGPGLETGQGTLTLSVPANSRAEMYIAVKPRKRTWFGQDITHRFDVAATPPGVEWEEKEARRASAELVYGPIMGWLTGMPLALRRALMIIIPLLILALLLFLLLRPKDDQNPASIAASQTQTAIAGLSPAQQTAAAQTAVAASAQQTAAAQAALGAAQQTAAAQTAIAGLSSANQTATAVAVAFGPLRVVRFDWVSTPDGGVQAAWEVTPPMNITVTINSTPVPPAGLQPVDIRDDVSLILEATNGTDQVSRALGLALLRPPTIKLFTADPVDAPCSGCIVTLRWEITRGEKANIDGTPVSDMIGSMEVKPGTTTQYLLTAENTFGSTQAITTVNVAEGLPTATPGAAESLPTATPGP
jgi:hypothetical protein